MTKESRIPNDETGPTPITFRVLTFFRHSEFVIRDFRTAAFHLATRAPFPFALPDRARESRRPTLRPLPGSTERAGRRGSGPRRGRARPSVRRPATISAD